MTKNVTIKLDSMTGRKSSWVFTARHSYAEVFMTLHRVKSMIMQSGHCVPLKYKEFEWEGLFCNDMWANPQCTPMPDPHLSQKLSKAGAEIIFLAINGGRDGVSSWSREVNWPFHEVNMRMRASAGRVWVVSADNSFPNTIPCSAPSGVLRPNGQWAMQVPRKGEHVKVFTIELLRKP